MADLPTAWQAEQIQRQQDRERMRPRILLSDELNRQQRAVTLILDGLEQHYQECLLAGRLDKWRLAAEASAALLATPNGIEFKHRTDT